ncbi:hypothetical protein ACU62J_16160 [Klebsiella aerogenes]
MKVDLKNTMIKVTFICLVMFCFTSIFSLLSARLNNPIIKLWKEIIVVLYYFMTIFYVFLARKSTLKKIVVCVFLPAFIIVLYLITALGNPLILVFYQVKSDLIPFFFVVGLIAVIDDSKDAFLVYYKLVKTLIIVGVINFALIIIQKIFTEWFMLFLQIDDFNNSSRGSGLRLDNVNESLRAMGSFTTFIASGTLMVICFILVNEVKLYKRWLRLSLSVMFLAGAIATTYKTAIIGIALYLLIKLIIYFFQGNRGIKNTTIIIYTICVFFSTCFAFNNYFLYNQLKNTSVHDLAYSSIYIRVKQHSDILWDVEKSNLITGVGIGVNGTEGPDGFKSSSKALDSTYVNILSNYGLLGVIVYLSILFTIMLTITAREQSVGENTALMLLLYHLSIEFFTNNILMNFPLNLFFYIFVAFPIFYKDIKK